jgi:hypothetical protein
VKNLDTLDSAQSADAVRLDAAEGRAWRSMYALAPAALGLSCHAIGDATALLAPALPLGLFNRAIGLGNTGAQASATIDRLLDLYGKAGARKFFIHAGPAIHPDVRRALTARGLGAGSPPSWAKAAYAGTPSAHQCALRIKVVGPTHGAELASVLCTAHGMPPILGPWIEALVAAEESTAYAAFDEDARIVGGAMLWFDGTDAWLGLGGTLPDARRQGVQNALLRRRAEDAIARGAESISTETWEPEPGGHNTSLANMLRSGFRIAYSRSNLQPG